MLLSKSIVDGENWLVDWLGPKPGPPRNLTITEMSNGFLVTWQQPLERSHLIQYYTIKYKTDGPWKTLNKGQIRPEETSYLGDYRSLSLSLLLSKCWLWQAVNNFIVLLLLCSEKSGGWQDLLLPSDGQFGHELWGERSGEIPGAGARQAQGHHGRRRGWHPLLHRGHHPQHMRRQDMQQAKTPKTRERCAFSSTRST